MLVFCGRKFEFYLISYSLRWDHSWWYSFYWEKIAFFRAKFLKQIIPMAIITCENVLCKIHIDMCELIIHQLNRGMQCPQRSLQWVLNVGKVDKICRLKHCYSWSPFFEKIAYLIFWSTILVFVFVVILWELSYETWLELYVKSCEICMNQRTPF